MVLNLFLVFPTDVGLLMSMTEPIGFAVIDTLESKFEMLILSKNGKVGVEKKKRKERLLWEQMKDHE